MELALSLQIRELEVLLGTSLFERESRGVFLTPFGRQAYEQMLRVLDEELVLETMGKRFEAGPFRISVGILSTLAPYLLTWLLDRLQNSQPRVELDVVEAPNREIISGLLAGRLDAAILALPLGMLELVELDLFEDRFLLAGRAERMDGFRALDNPPSTDAPAQSDFGPFLTLGHDHCLSSQVLGACSMWRLEEFHRGSESLATLSKLVASGAGVALLPESAALVESSASPELQFLRFSPPEPSRRIGLAHRVASRDQRWVKLLADATRSTGQMLAEEAREAIPPLRACIGRDGGYGARGVRWAPPDGRCAPTAVGARPHSAWRHLPPSTRSRPTAEAFAGRPVLLRLDGPPRIPGAHRPEATHSEAS